MLKKDQFDTSTLTEKDLFGTPLSDILPAVIRFPDSELVGYRCKSSDYETLRQIEQLRLDILDSQPRLWGHMNEASRKHYRDDMGNRLLADSCGIQDGRFVIYAIKNPHTGELAGSAIMRELSSNEHRYERPFCKLLQKQYPFYPDEHAKLTYNILRQNKEIGEFSAFYIKEPYKSDGIMREMACRFVRSGLYPYLALTTHFEGSLELYKAIGFQETTRKTFGTDGGFTSLLVMDNNLSFRERQQREQQPNLIGV